jgi:hypothetical protein
MGQGSSPGVWGLVQIDHAILGNVARKGKRLTAAKSSCLGGGLLAVVETVVSGGYAADAVIGQQTEPYRADTLADSYSRSQSSGFASAQRSSSP